MSRDVRKVVVLGANGAMGAGSGEVFAAAGIPTVLLARTRDKALIGQQRAEKMAKAEALSAAFTLGSYSEDLEREVADADLVIECVAENLELKKTFFERIDAARKPGSIISTVSSGLSIAEMVEGRSEDFQRCFLGIHLFNPPNVIVGCEVIPHQGTDPELTRFVIEFCESRLGRKMVQTSDTPAFAGNRVGFKVLNEVALLAAEHGVAFMNALIGPHTGRAMAPLTTVDFVGWDVHKAIVDNVYANTDDEAHDAFRLPEYMESLIAAGHLGRKTPDKGGFFRKVGSGKEARTEVLDAAKGEYVPFEPVNLPDFVAAMSGAIRVGRYGRAMDIMCEATGKEADLMRKVVLGYVSYGLNRVGEVVESPAGVDRIMGFGFNWAPPGVLVDVIGAKRVVSLLEGADIPVPAVVSAAADSGERIFNEPNVDRGRFFFA
jgi:3-hydroxyacyl-CoA dehydrogenase